MQPLFDAELAACVNGNFEFSTLAGAYSGHLEYMSVEWLEANIKEIFPVDRRANLACAVAGLAYAAGALTALIPTGFSLALHAALERLALPAPLWLVASGTLVVACFLAAFVFGAYLALLTRLGLEHTQAFTALDHPGFKHFLKLRVRADGRGVDGYCIGLSDPLEPGEKPVLVDRFEWRF